MPKIISKDDFDRLIATIQRHPQGIDAEDLQAEMGGAVSRRTIQRRLSQLVAEQRIIGERGHRSVRYRLGNRGVVALAALQVEARAEGYIPVSPEGEQVRAYVRQPVQGRRPVGYDVAFLDAYHPNQTWYLPEGLRSQLHALGRSPDDHAPAGTFAQNILDRLLIDLSWASSRLEGNTYSRIDTERLIRDGEAAEGKDAIETQMILNHKAAIEFLVHGVDQHGLDASTVISLHALLSDGLLADPMACGRLRRRAVDIGGSVYRPMALPQRVEELFGMVLAMAAQIADPFEQAFFLTVHLPYLQPFEDVNKRVSRLAANIPLIKANLARCRSLTYLSVPMWMGCWASTS